MSSSKLNRRLTQAFGILLGIAIAVWVLRGLGFLSFIPGGLILLLFFGAIAIGIISHVQKTWWRF
jgi:F0F1-type ATP synthase assembly protein I